MLLENNFFLNNILQSRLRKIKITIPELVTSDNFSTWDFFITCFKPFGNYGLFHILGPYLVLEMESSNEIIIGLINNIRKGITCYIHSNPS